VLDARRYRIIFLVRSIEFSPVLEFPRVGYDDLSYGIFRVIPVDQGEIIFIGTEGESVGHLPKCIPLVL